MSFDTQFSNLQRQKKVQILVKGVVFAYIQTTAVRGFFRVYPKNVVSREHFAVSVDMVTYRYHLTNKKNMKIKQNLTGKTNVAG